MYSLPLAISMPHPISRPRMHSSIRISSLSVKASATAGKISASLFTLVTPNELPLALGFTNTGRPSVRTISFGSIRLSRLKKKPRASGIPNSATVRLVVILSKVTTDEVIEQEEYGISIMSR